MRIIGHNEVSVVIYTFYFLAFYLWPLRNCVIKMQFYTYINIYALPQEKQKAITLLPSLAFFTSTLCLPAK